MVAKELPAPELRWLVDNRGQYYHVNVWGLIPRSKPRYQILLPLMDNSSGIARQALQKRGKQ